MGQSKLSRSTMSISNDPYLDAEEALYSGLFNSYEMAMIEKRGGPSILRSGGYGDKIRVTFMVPSWVVARILGVGKGKIIKLVKEGKINGQYHGFDYKLHHGRVRYRWERAYVPLSSLINLKRNSPKLTDSEPISLKELTFYE